MTTLEFHPLANRFPLIDGDEFENLIEDIRANGQREPIVLYENRILDGRNRYRACLAAGLNPKTRQFSPSTEGSAEAFVISLNAFRRHLTNEQKQELIVELLKANHSVSDRAIARQVGVDHKTVGAIRKRMNEDLEKFTRKFKSFGPEQQRTFVQANKDSLQKLLAS